MAVKRKGLMRIARRRNISYGGALLWRLTGARIAPPSGARLMACRGSGIRSASRGARGKMPLVAAK